MNNLFISLLIEQIKKVIYTSIQTSKTKMFSPVVYHKANTHLITTPIKKQNAICI